jgi:CheY-like chemotaxis protein
MTNQMRSTMSPKVLDYPVRLNRAATLLAAAGAASDGRDARQQGADGQAGERLLGKRILIVEDEALVAYELQLALEDEGAEVVGPALSLMKALEAVTHEGEIDLAVLDIDIAGEDIYPVAELLLQRGVPFLFHTGHGSRSALAALFPGTATFIKPTLPERLITHLLRIAR